MVEIRLATIMDSLEIASIYAPFVQNTSISFEYKIPSIEEICKRITKTTQNFPYLVCAIDGEVVGYAYACRLGERAGFSWDAELSVYVKSEYTRRRIAYALYEGVIKMLTLQGYKNAFAAISLPNEQSVNFHKAIGFIEVGKFKKAGFKNGEWLDLLYMQKQLGKYELNMHFPISMQKLNESEVKSILFECKNMVKQQ